MIDSSIKYSVENDRLKIVISPKLNDWVKYGTIVFYISPFVIILVLSVYLMVADAHSFFSSYKTALLLIGGCVLSILLSRIFLKRLFEKEILEISKNDLIIKKAFLFETKKMVLKNQDILNIEYVDKEIITDNIIDKGTSSDYLGFKLAEKEIDFLLKMEE